LLCVHEQGVCSGSFHSSWRSYSSGQACKDIEFYLNDLLAFGLKADDAEPAPHVVFLGFRCHDTVIYAVLVAGWWYVKNRRMNRVLKLDTIRFENKRKCLKWAVIKYLLLVSMVVLPLAIKRDSPWWLVGA
jgi:hypothetical protein